MRIRTAAFAALCAIWCWQCGTAEDATPAPANPDGKTVVFTPNPLEPVMEGPDLSATNHPACEIKLAGARGGSFSAQVVVHSGTPVKGPEAKIGDLKAKNGAPAIPASAIEIRYALPTGVNGISVLPKGHKIFDALSPTPRESGATHPVWVTVNVPADAVPGEYEGALSVAGRDVPVKLSVADWTLPRPQDYATWVDFVQSPESVAMRYDKKFWSDEHWKLVEKSFEQLAKLGNKTIYIPLMCQTHFGNSETMVRWIAKTGKTTEGEGKTNAPQFEHDFSIAEKYLDIFISRVGKPKIAIFYIYEGFLGGSQGKNAEECGRGVPFTLLDPKTGEITTAAGPTHNNANPAYPNYPDDTIAFWKPVIDGMHERLKARGIEDECFTLGMSPDLAPGKLQMEYLAKTFPYARWTKQGHGLQAGKMGPMLMGYDTTVWQAAFAKSPADRLYGWKQYKIPVAMYDRDIWKPDYRGQLVRSRLLGEMNITGKQRGFGRMSADFWPCMKDAKGNLRTLINRYPLSNWAQLSMRMTPYLYPGPDGALTTVRFEMMREGVQECEARIFIEKTFLDKEKRAKLGEELVTKVQGLLDQRVAAILDAMKKGAKGQGGLQETSADFAQGPWRERSAQLYAAASEVAAALKSEPVAMQTPGAAAQAASLP